MVETTALVSIITPVYNGEAYIGRAIESVINQSYTNWEMLVIDDGSTDQTAAVIRKYTDRRIKTWRQHNQGRSVARNLGLAEARGEYVLFLDSDDVLLPKALEIHLDYLGKHSDCAASISDCEVIDHTGQHIAWQSELRKHFVPDYDAISRGVVSILEPLIVSSALIGASNSVMVRREIIEQCKAQFDVNMFMGEDTDFWLQIAAHAYFSFIEPVTCQYYWHSGNTLFTHKRPELAQSQLRGRLKVLNASYFNSLSIKTREHFMYNLLFNLLDGNVDKQLEIVNWPQFASLDKASQSDLLRELGFHLLEKRTERRIWQPLFSRAKALDAGFSKSCFAWILAGIMPGILRVIQTRRRESKQAKMPSSEGVSRFLAALPQERI